MSKTTETVTLDAKATAKFREDSQPLPGLEGGPTRGGGYTPLPCRICGNDWAASNCTCELPQDARYDW
mgnify:CR=1 FL=1